MIKYININNIYSINLLQIKIILSNLNLVYKKMIRGVYSVVESVNIILIEILILEKIKRSIRV